MARELSRALFASLCEEGAKMRAELDPDTCDKYVAVTAILSGHRTTVQPPQESITAVVRDLCMFMDLDFERVKVAQQQIEERSRIDNPYTRASQVYNTRLIETLDNLSRTQGLRVTRDLDSMLGLIIASSNGIREDRAGEECMKVFMTVVQYLVRRLGVDDRILTSCLNMVRSDMKDAGKS